MTDLYRGLACAAARCTSSRSSWATSTPRTRCSASRSPTPPTSSSRCGSWPASAPRCCDAIEQHDADFVQAPALGRRPAGAAARPTSPWPCNDTKYIAHFPETREIWSLRLRLRRQRPAGQEVLRAAHRLGDGPRRGLAGRAHAHPQAHLARRSKVHYIAGGLPVAPAARPTSPCSSPTIPGWKVETLGDDIAWMRFGEDGRLYAVNPEFGLFGVAPGTDWNTNPNAMRTIDKGNSIFTNVALTDDGDVWWEGMDRRAAGAPDRLEGQRLDARSRDEPVQPTRTPASAPRSRSARSWPPEYDDPQRRADLGDPLRRPPQDHHPAGRPRPATGRTASSWARRSRRRPPPPRPARSASSAATRWRCCRSSATTPATTSSTGSTIGKDADASKLPKIFYVNWFRRDDGRRLPVARLRRELPRAQVGRRAARGHAPTPSRPRSASCPTAGRPRHRRPGHDARAGRQAALAVDADEWRAELPLIEEWFAKFGDKLPTALWTELDALKARLGVK